MAFPHGGYTLGATSADAHEARSCWAQVAAAVAGFEPVTMVVDPADRGVAVRYLPGEVEIVEAPLDDAWMRDMGPTFVLDDDGRLGAVDWVFNGWGQQDWASWEHDAVIGQVVTHCAGAVPVPSSLVNEGGGMHVDGDGTVLVTRTVQLDPGRNPGWTADEVEDELARTLGTDHVVWLPRGLHRDAQRFGTRGHVDIVATIAAPGLLLVHDQPDASHPDHVVCAELRTVLESSTDARGRRWEVRDLSAPSVLRDDDGWVDYSYVNHLVVNGGVVACGFCDPADEPAREALAAAYPGRDVVMVDARPLFARGGGIHCITQQQPAAR